MVTVNLVGGARKSFQTDSLEITQNICLEKLIKILLEN